MLYYFFPLTGYAQVPVFGDPAFYELGGQYPTDLEVVDINNDGKLDVVSTTEVGKVNFLMGDGNGRLLKENSLAFFNVVKDVTVTDFNGDGVMDLAIAVGDEYAGTWHGTKVYLGSGGDKALFTFKREFFRVTGPLATGDFNGDGHTDLVVHNVIADLSAGMGILFGKGDGTFSKPKKIGGNATRLSVADLNGDGHDDLVSETGRYLSNGDGTFTVLAGGAGLRVAGDLNGDGLDDLVQVIPSALILQISLSHADGTASHASMSVTAEAADMQIVDMNRDGHADVLIRFTGANDLTFYEGVGDGTLLAGQAIPALPYYSRLRSRHFIAGDWNQDGYMDLALPDWLLENDSSLWVKLQVPDAVADQQPPAVSLAGIGNGDRVAYRRSLRAIASANAGVTRVKFLVDGNPIGVSAGPDFVVRFETRLLTDGTHTLTANSAAVAVNVDNTSAYIYSAPPLMISMWVKPFSSMCWPRVKRPCVIHWSRRWQV